MEIDNTEFKMTYSLLSPIIIKIMAIEKTLLESDMKNKYLENKEFWSIEMKESREKSLQSFQQQFPELPFS